MTIPTKYLIETKSETLPVVRVGPDALGLILEAVELSGMSQSDWIRMALIARARAEVARALREANS